MPPYLPQKVTMSRCGDGSKTAFDPTGFPVSITTHIAAETTIVS